MRFQLFHRPVAVQKEGTAFFQACGNIIFVYIRLIMYGYKVCKSDQIRSADRLMPEAQMRDSDTTGFFRIVGEVTLRIHIRMVADNLDRAFVGADSAVTAQAPEFTAFGRGRSSIQRGSYRQRGIGNIVNDAYSEIIFRFCCSKIFKNRQHFRRSQLFTAQAITAADDER